MNFLYENIQEEFKEDDLLLFIDADAWPIKDWVKPVDSLLEEHAVVAVERRENPEPLLKEEHKPYPHPTFFAVKAKFWKENYEKGLRWALRIEDSIQTAGPTIKHWLKDNGYTSYPLLRTNCINIHPLYYGIYGDIVYHHGAGTRPKYDSADIWLRTGLNPAVDLDLRYPMILDFNQRISDMVLEEIKQNDLFVNVYLLGKL
jgi:hypothetical protein